MIYMGASTMIKEFNGQIWQRATEVPEISQECVACGARVAA